MVSRRFFLGKSDLNDEAIVATAKGIRMGRTIHRLPDAPFEPTLVDGIVGVPWDIEKGLEEAQPAQRAAPGPELPPIFQQPQNNEDDIDGGERNPEVFVIGSSNGSNSGSDSEERPPAGPTPQQHQDGEASSSTPAAQQAPGTPGNSDQPASVPVGGSSASQAQDVMPVEPGTPRGTKRTETATPSPSGSPNRWQRTADSWEMMGTQATKRDAPEVPPLELEVKRFRNTGGTMGAMTIEAETKIVSELGLRELQEEITGESEWLWEEPVVLARDEIITDEELWAAREEEVKNLESFSSYVWRLRDDMKKRSQRAVHLKQMGGHQERHR